MNNITEIVFSVEIKNRYAVSKEKGFAKNEALENVFCKKDKRNIHRKNKNQESNT